MMTEHHYRSEGRPRVLLNLHPDGPGGPTMTTWPARSATGERWYLAKR